MQVAEWEVIPNTGDIGKFFGFGQDAYEYLYTQPDGTGMVGYDWEGHGIVEYEKVGGIINRVR